jgi:hypothetical protein
VTLLPYLLPLHKRTICGRSTGQRRSSEGQIPITCTLTAGRRFPKLGALEPRSGVTPNLAFAIICSSPLRHLGLAGILMTRLQGQVRM